MKPKLLILDNFDSFTYNLMHYAEPYCAHVEVIRNHKISWSNIAKFDKIILSPGPGLPQDAGKMMEVIDRYFDKKPILGICLGMQAIGEYFGATLENLKTVFHGIQAPVYIKPKTDYVYQNIPTEIQVGRYHSWVVSQNDLPACLNVTATDDQGFIMSLKHEIYDVRGVQFHPESIMTEYGKIIIKNWIENIAC